ncbi:magnesium transporter CorA family protein [Nonomuraea turcica]|uniref:hypothetical protein n=1 Tax=Nonomuraea sp. G32 TaxID=3067274 RepID=UPI00273B5F73|nr:hypothetical protein [Nonomuraea sp. G32]MDP4503724.1 hypothetical protein [Nonomuraea sp. G32]
MPCTASTARDFPTRPRPQLSPTDLCLGGGEFTEDIYSLKREVLEFRAAQDPLVPVLEEIVKGQVELCTVAREHFRDVLDHLLRVDAQVDEHNELLTSALSAHLALVSREHSTAAMQQNADMRKMVIAVIIVHRLLRKSGWL